MSGGSTEPEDEHDKQCPTCGLYYVDQGVSFEMHRASCNGSSDETSPSDPGDSPPSANSEDAAENPILGSGDVPETDSGTELPCGHESIDLDAYDAGTYIKCDTCDHLYHLT
jgi:uncharacterized Zn-finger protein